MTTESTSTGTRYSLLAQARARNPAAWRELVDLYTPLVAYWIRKCGLDSADTADCIQEVFTAVATSIDSYKASGTSGSFRSWLWTVTRNKVRDLIRRKRRHPKPRGGSTAWHELNAVPAESDIPDEEPTDSSHLDELIARGLEQIRSEFQPHSWQAFWRTAVDNIPDAVAAKELDMSPAAIRQNRSRILRRLREQLGDVQ